MSWFFIFSPDGPEVSGGILLFCHPELVEG
jgi:hypothetical protein